MRKAFEMLNVKFSLETRIVDRMPVMTFTLQLTRELVIVEIREQPGCIAGAAGLLILGIPRPAPAMRA